MKKRRSAKRTPSVQARMLIAATCIFFISMTSHANDNALAHKLFEQGHYAQAAEIFTDPAWKGVALYRSEQWWRAAEAFVRADDADSHYNLGNCYVKLGYYSLALEAYQRALDLENTHEDARFNAELMLTLLENEDEAQQGDAVLKPKEIERVDSKDEKESSAASGGDKNNESGESAEKQKERDGTESTEETREDAQQGKTGDSTNSSRANDENDGTSEVSGLSNEHQDEARASGKSDSEQGSDDSQAAGMRMAIETEQANEQWLNQIRHDPYRFLQKRIELEKLRRAANGQSPPEGGSPW